MAETVSDVVLVTGGNGALGGAMVARLMTDGVRVVALERSKSGELQLEILVENMRREGYELMVSKPTVVTRQIDGQLHEPVELLVIDVADDYIGVVSQLLAVRKGNLTAKEWVEMKKHAAFTHSILLEIPWEGELTLVPEWAGSHHEKLDGTGYHRGLSGERVPIGGQILAMVDIYEALTASDRPYKKSFTREEAIKFLEECGRTNWLNPDLVALFVEKKIFETPLTGKAAIPGSSAKVA